MQVRLRIAFTRNNITGNKNTSWDTGLQMSTSDGAGGPILHLLQQNKESCFKSHRSRTRILRPSDEVI